MSKRVGEHRLFEKSEKRPRHTYEEMVNVREGARRGSASASLQTTTIEQLEKYVRAGNQAAARQLLDTQSVDLKTSEGGDLLWTAYALGKKEIVMMLVRYGADLSARKHLDERTLLHHMLRGSQIKSATTRKMFYLMLDYGADVDARDNEDNSLLYDAITNRHRESMKLAEELLKRGARITVDKGNGIKNDIYLASKHKMELLPKLIEYQKPNEETRDQRVTMAVEGLISEQYRDDEETAAALLMIEKISGLGVSVNVPDNRGDKLKSSFLDTALQHKNIAVVELLLKWGADPHHQNHFGHTILYQATAFKDTTQVSRWFIERGVNIQAQNFHGGHPIHGACKNESVKNLNLLLNLGADLNSTDRYGQTPLDLIMMKKKHTELHELTIKYLALMNERGEEISEKNRAKIYECDRCISYFVNCSKTLELMKKEKVHRDISYISLFSKNAYMTVQMVKDQHFLDSFERDGKRRALLFKKYSSMLSHSFEVAKKKLEVLLAEKDKLYKVFVGTLPGNVIEKIAYYTCFEKLKHCHYEYFMSFHAKNDIQSKKNKKR